MFHRLTFALLAFTLPAFAQTTAESFETNVLPILRTQCWACHSDKNLTSGLSLQSRDMITKGGNRGADPKVILEAVKQSGDLKMPPGKKLTDTQIAAIEKWVTDGLPMPDRMLKARRNGADHWAFQPPKKAALPTDRKSTRLNSSHLRLSRMPSSA